MYQKLYKIIVFCLLLILFCVSGYCLMRINSEYQKGKVEYEKLEEIAIIEEEPESVTSTDEPVPEEPTKEICPIDFQALKDINKDTVAWIQFKDLETINYPVVQGTDNKTYLNYTFEGNQSRVGTIFIDSENADDFTDKNTIIFGHNRKDGTMFGQLKKYREKDFYEKHPYFHIYTQDGRKLTYEIFAVCIVDARSESYTMEFTDNKAFQDYIEYVRNISLYSTEVDVKEDSQIVSLSTCTSASEYERLMVHTVKTEEIELEIIN